MFLIKKKPQYLLIHAQFTRNVIFWPLVTYPNDFVESNLLLYRHVLYSSNICEILLYNPQCVVITHELICGVPAAHPLGKIFLEWDYCIQMNYKAVGYMYMAWYINYTVWDVLENTIFGNHLMEFCIIRWLLYLTLSHIKGLPGM